MTAPPTAPLTFGPLGSESSSLVRPPGDSFLPTIIRLCAGVTVGRESLLAVLVQFARALGASEARFWWVDESGTRPGPGLRASGLVSPVASLVAVPDPATLDLALAVAPSCHVPSSGSSHLNVRVLAETGVPGVLFLPIRSFGVVVGVVEVHASSTRLWPAALVEQAAVAAEVLGLALGADRERSERARLEERRAAEAAAGELEQARLEEQLVHTVRLAGLGEVTAGVVHDLAQPLLVLQAYLELLHSEGGGTALQVSALPVMARATDRMMGLVRHLRNYARSDGAESVPFELYETAKLARDLCSGSMRESVTIEGERGVIVWGDSARIEQVIVNLVTNALQAGGAPVSVRLGREESGPREGWGRVEVVDHGHGVPVELRDRVFEPFFTTRPRGQGTGLGLAICTRIVREHGGVVEYDAPLEGGACFRVLLPTRPPA